MYADLKTKCDAMLNDIEKFELQGHGAKAAAKRARKLSLEVEKMLKQFRKQSV